MASQRDAQVEQAKQLHQHIQEMTEKVETLEGQIGNLDKEKTQIQEQLQALNSRLGEVQREHNDKTQEIRTIQSQLEEKESRYMKMLEAQPSLVHVFKK
eukprot:CAMPEP_0204264924 /NCGR_PEP_ID=MMETSP0468-20130131/9342_1 /ASSEMBLY_ACC=CAM_ASM_000383 /TAXON_ID=2969 /ORGANISM="Oxyrrhis marina" /LENGTH=98 /DNA_ID=CAMNT_0051239837 /DNA_START=57 /DNA_END=353 /DNA_ORIENTATION=+